MVISLIILLMQRQVVKGAPDFSQGGRRLEALAYVIVRKTSPVPDNSTAAVRFDGHNQAGLG